MGRWALAAGTALILAAGAAPAAGSSWYFQDGPATLLLAGAVDDIQFLARCQDEAMEVIYFAPDRPSLASGTRKACNGLRPCLEAVPVALLVDGKVTDLAARAQPEEMFGGYEIHFSLKPQDPFWAEMAGGKTLSMRIDGKVGEALSLKTIARPLGRLMAACGA